MISKITLKLRTLSPLHITAPEKGRLDVDGKKVFGKRGFPHSLTQKMTLPLRTEDVMDDKRSVSVPIIPANTLRGRLRRMSAKSILTVLEEKGETLSLAAWQGLQSGAIYGHPDSALPSLDRMSEDYDSVYLGTWGGSSRLAPSVVSVGTAFPVVDATVNMGLIPDSAMDEAVGGRLTQSFFMRRVDDTVLVADPSRGNQIHEIDKSYSDWIKLFGPQVKAAAGDSDEETSEKEVSGKIQGVSSFSAREVVSPNITFVTDIECRGQEHHLGMVIEAIRQWVKDPYIGGCRRLGMGRLEIQAELDGQNIFVATSEGPEVDEGHAQAAEAHTQALDAIKKLAAGDIEALFKPEPNSVASVKKKLKGEEAEAFARLYQ